ncbi:hypothetical protein PFLG_00802 [Plasmodium falciparum RAJ116]|uniref:Uncharacterized protein n=1 Tax=Plasmodium falciparum RAJ116 TaxID=580058 RepID=A0A0L0CU38_PLAFA|nr:hypothetical protein PFLG_00802 [Plasmodium falciparum RAJ116]
METYNENYFLYPLKDATKGKNYINGHNSNDNMFNDNMFDDNMFDDNMLKDQNSYVQIFLNKNEVILQNDKLIISVNHPNIRNIVNHNPFLLKFIDKMVLENDTVRLKNEELYFTGSEMTQTQDKNSNTNISLLYKMLQDSNYNKNGYMDNTNIKNDAHMNENNHNHIMLSDCKDINNRSNYNDQNNLKRRPVPPPPAGQTFPLHSNQLLQIPTSPAKHPRPPKTLVKTQRRFQRLRSRPRMHAQHC